ncbi:MAG: NifU family protein [Bacteroidetes bacterium]|nr:NifU family protein [Bacteroidota bacterium]
MESKQRIENALDSIRPFLKADGGDVELLSIEPDHVVHIRLLGACGNCDISHITMKAGIEDSIRKVYPELKAVIAVN